MMPLRLCLLSLFFITISTLSCITLANADASPNPIAGNGLINQPSQHSVAITADRFEQIVLKKGMTVFNRINHAQGAKKIGKVLRPTELILFGKPEVGTPLMQCGQSIAIDLPQKALIWEDASGQVWLSYNDPQYLLTRHALKGCDEVIKKVTKALSGLAHAATAP